MSSRGRIRGSAGMVGLAILVLADGCGGDPAAPPVPGYSITVSLEEATLEPGAIVFVDVEVRDPRGRPAAHPVTLTTDDSGIAVVDARGRLRAVGVGETQLHVRSSVAERAVTVSVVDGPATLALERFDGHELPLLFDADSVWWDGGREYHEVYVVSGHLTLTGAPRPGYDLSVRYEQFQVREEAGELVLSLRAAWRERDRGEVAYDADGDLVMTSEWVYPLSHTAEPVRGGVRVDFRVPGTDIHMELGYARGAPPLAGLPEPPPADVPGAP